MILFSISALEKAPVTLIGDEPPEFADLQPDELITVTAPVHYELTAAKVSGGVLVTGKCTTSISGECGRCLTAVTKEVAADSFQLFFEVGDNQEELDVSEDIRAELLLEFPMNLLCSDECRGLCLECGTNLNTGKCNCPEKGGTGRDSRWNALDGLKF